MDSTTLADLRRRYIDAAQRSARSTHNIDQHVAAGTTPSEEELRAQSEARDELISARRAYLQALNLLRTLGFIMKGDDL